MIFELFIFYPFFVGVGNSHLSVNNLRFDQEASQNCYHHCYCTAWAYCYIAPWNLGMYVLVSQFLQHEASFLSLRE